MERGRGVDIGCKIEPLKEGGYLATTPLLHGLIAQGRTIAETLEIAQDVARKLIESHIEHGDPLPQELSTVELRKIKSLYRRGYRGGLLKRNYFFSFVFLSSKLATPRAMANKRQTCANEM